MISYVGNEINGLNSLYVSIAGVLVLLEAQAKGLPCVSFGCKQGPSEIIGDGVNGFLVEPNNVDEFAKKLFTLMQDKALREKFSQNSHKDLYRFNTKK